MAFLAPLIAAAIPGLGAVGSALVTAGLGLGLSFAANKLKAKENSSVASGSRVGLTIDTNPSRQMIIGETSTGGSLVFWHLSGTDNAKLWMVIALADHECNSLQSVIVSGKNKAWNSGTGEVADYNGKLKVRFYSGAAGQAADSALVAASGGRWTSNEVGTGVCYVVVEAEYDETLFPEGIPELGFVVRGAKLLDPRTGTSAYSQNATSAINTVLRGVVVSGEPLLGMNVPAAAIRSAEAQAAANACAEAVALGAGGTEERYRCNCILDCSSTNADHIETILASMAGEVIESGGIYRIMAGVAQTAVAHITDDDLTIGEPLPWKPKRGRNSLVNAVQGSYYDPSRLYTPVGLPPRTSSLDEAADGGIRLPVTIDLQAVTSRTQAQRILEIERRKARRMGTVTGNLRARWFVLEPGDWITFTSARRGFVAKTFVIDGCDKSSDLRSDIVLNEIDAEYDDWDTSLEISDDQVISLPPAGPALSSVTPIALENTTLVGSPGQQRPALTITYTPITDPTVVQIKLEFRKVGDSISIERVILDPAAGSYTWADSVQGAVQYEARLLPVTRPERATTWTAWIATLAVADPQIVSAAAVANSVPDDTITHAMLSPQARLELERVTASETAANSVSARILEATRQAQEAAQAALGAIAENTMQMRGVRATAAGSTIAITEAFSAVGGAERLAAQWVLAIDLNGNVIGMVSLSGDEDYSQFSVVADRFAFQLPGGIGPPTPFLTLVTLEGEQTAVLNGTLIANAFKANQVDIVQLSAIASDLGLVRAGRIEDINNLFYKDLTNGVDARTDGRMTVDFKNIVLEMIF